MKKIIALLVVFVSFCSHAQIRGTVNDEKGNPIPFANVFIENTYKGTTSNEQGKYEINLTIKGKYTFVFQYLGYKTQKKTVEIASFPFVLNINMEEEN